MSSTQHQWEKIFQTYFHWLSFRFIEFVEIDNCCKIIIKINAYIKCKLYPIIFGGGYTVFKSALFDIIKCLLCYPHTKLFYAYYIEKRRPYISCWAIVYEQICYHHLLNLLICGSYFSVSNTPTATFFQHKSNL